MGAEDAGLQSRLHAADTKFGSHASSLRTRYSHAMSKVTMKPDPAKASLPTRRDPSELIAAARGAARGTTEVQLFTDDEEAMIRQLDARVVKAEQTQA
ncbi:MAG: hypothetical protein JWL76_724 [Thermoleophilia bacterium]|nr:hypothetical protein [Thermoleophilia bacterium]